jgi:predicted ester cyclase
MSTNTIINKAVVAQFINELFGELSSDNMHALITEDFHVHAWGSRTRREGARNLHYLLSTLRNTFANPEVTILEMTAQDDRVASRYLFRARYVNEVGGVDVKGHIVSLHGVLLARLDGEKITECWLEDDRLGMLRHLREAA